MLKKTITKNPAFVISLALFCFLTNACNTASSQPDKSANAVSNQISKDYSAPRVVGKIESDEIRESSGLTASKCRADVFWTHNDSGDRAFLYAFDPKGKKLATYLVENAKNEDWEDLASYKNSAGECFLYIGDIGNNERQRGEQTIYRVKEPDVFSADSDKKNPLTTEAAEAVKFVYPDFRHDAETLLIHPLTGDLYVITKKISGAAGVTN